MNSKIRIKLLSFLITVTMLLSGLTFVVHAETEIGYEVSLSNSVTGIGKEVVLTVALSNYSTQSDQIRGLQIDIGNIDTAVLSVVSYNSLIVDSTAVSNTASYSQNNSRVRLVYANFSGTLPASNGEDGKMKVFEVRFKINGELDADGQIELPVTVKLQTTNKQITLNSSNTITYAIQPSSVCSVNVFWSSMNFTYVDGAWDPVSHEYSDGEWSSNNNGGQITVENVGNTSISATFEYLPIEEYNNITGTFNIGNSIVSVVDIAVNEKQIVSFNLSGKPNTALTNAVLGIITLTIKLPE